MSKTYSNRSNARRAAIAAGIPADSLVIEGQDGRFTFRDARAMIALATENEDLGVVPQADAATKAKEYADETGAVVHLRDPLTDKVIGAVKPAKKTGKKKAEVKGNGKSGGPSGMVAKIIELATRPEGVTRTELNEVTKWKGAPWKWLMQNPKGTGYADRWGYSLEVIKDGRAVSYKLERA